MRVDNENDANSKYILNTIHINAQTNVLKKKHRHISSNALSNYSIDEKVHFF